MSLYGLEVLAHTDDRIEGMLSKMTLEQKVGQLLVFGYRGTSVQEGTLELIQELKPGGIISFRHNVGTLSELAQKNHSLQLQSIRHSGLPLLIMVDQEGGPVVRIRTQPPPLSAAAVGQTGDPSVAESVGRLTGRLLRQLGFNMNLAPVLDLSDPYSPSFIGQRSFGQDPQRVGVMGTRFAEGLWKEAVLPTAKHFPGHGAILEDSHHTLPVKKASLEELLQSDLIPFASFSQAAYPSAIMMAHMAFPLLDPSGTPSSFSRPIIKGLLRTRLGYRGIVLTDDLEMQGADFYRETGERAVRAIEAGNDMVMIAWTLRHQRSAQKALIKAVKSGRISEERLHRSLRRILATKLQLPQPELQANPSTIDFEEFIRQINQAQMRLSQSISRWHFSQGLQREARLKRGLGKGRQVFVYSADAEFFSSLKAMKSESPMPIHIPIGPRNPAQSHPQMLDQPESLAVFYLSGTGSLRQLRALPASVKMRTIVVNTTYPGALRERHQYFAVIDTYSQDPQIGLWLGEYLY